MALLEPHRSADVLADASASAVEISIGDFERFPQSASKPSERICAISHSFCRPPDRANTKVNLLTATVKPPIRSAGAPRRRHVKN